jgi:hypothetical protein
VPTQVKSYYSWFDGQQADVSLFVLFSPPIRMGPTLNRETIYVTQATNLNVNLRQKYPDRNTSKMFDWASNGPVKLT